MINEHNLKCTFCGKSGLSKTGRKKHNKICAKNPTRHRIGGSKAGRMAAFQCMAEDLPDGAYGWDILATKARNVKIAEKKFNNY